jgi:D-serine deaminase-like pyridoxal phosphate-dependent protein
MLDGVVEGLPAAADAVFYRFCAIATRKARNMAGSPVNMNLENIPTPALVLDARVVQHNIDRLARYSKEHGMRVRPHTKTHKSRELSAMQMAAGSLGLTVAKVGEAEVLADLTDDLLIAYPAWDPSRAERLANLARERTVRVAVDSVQAADRIAQAARKSSTIVGLLVEIDVGMRRTGVPDPQAALGLAQQIDRLPGARLDGLMCYPGHVWSAPQDQPSSLKAVADKLQETIDAWQRCGLAASIVSGGSTPTAFQSHWIPQLTEIRPGTYVFNDLNEWRAGFCSLDDCAARIITTVVSNAVRGQVVIDSGTKTLTSDLCLVDKTAGHGYLVQYPAAKITRLSEEHGQIDVSQSETQPALGERIAVIPNHICPCVNLQDSVWWLEADGNVRKMVVDGRGKLS